jgi:hypothetical protein
MREEEKMRERDLVRERMREMEREEMREREERETEEKETEEKMRERRHSFGGKRASLRASLCPRSLK